MINIVVVSLCLIVISACIAFNTVKIKNPDLTLAEFLNMTHLSTRTIVAGMAGGFIFGFINIVAMWFGMSTFSAWFSRHGVSENEASSYANMYGNVIASIAGTFVALTVSTKADVDLNTTPLWANTLGILLGCIVGIMAGKVI
jgi:hypothetical protein